MVDSKPPPVQLHLHMKLKKLQVGRGKNQTVFVESAPHLELEYKINLSRSSISYQQA